MLLVQEGLPFSKRREAPRPLPESTVGNCPVDITIGGLKNSEEINIILPKCGHSLG